MEDQDFWDKIIGDRIAILLGIKDAEQREMKLMKENNSILEGLDQETRQRIGTQMNLMIDKIEDSERKIYIQGMKDGIKLMKWIQKL